MAVTETLKALADENRLRIIESLADGERCVCEIASELDASDALVSHHIKQLREAGLIRTRRVGRWLHCSLEPVAFEQLGVLFAALAGRATAASADGCCSCSTPAAKPVEYPTKDEEIWP